MGVSHGVSQRLAGRFCQQNEIAVCNTFILGSPWEADLIRVTPAWYWVEYEMKVTVADFKKDFSKSHNYVPPWDWRDGDDWKSHREKHLTKLNKHDSYASPKNIPGEIPKPKQFYFVTPKDLVELEQVPDHCGLIEWEERPKPHWPRFTIVKRAPRLKGHSKLTDKQIHNIAVKVSSRWRHLKE